MVGWMSTVRLSSTSYLVLGLIGLRGPSTPYELKRAVERSGLGEFWPFPHSQLYDEPSRLTDAGLLVEEREDEGRRRRVYDLTDEGWTELRAWTREPDAAFQLRDVASLKMFFSELGASDDDVAATADVQVRFHAERLARFEAMFERYKDRPERARRLIPLRLGIQITRTALQFWEEIAQHPPEAPARDQSAGELYRPAR
jgi:DNA-binding PadR family transcriptional regulator